MHNLLQDLRYALRQLRRGPAFTITAVLTLTLGICANVTIYTFIDNALISPLPYRQPSKLVAIFETRQQQVSSQFEASYPDYLDWKRQNNVFESIAGYNGPRAVIFSGGKSPERIQGAFVSDNFFQTLGTSPTLGRDFRNGEDLVSAPRTVILSYRAWQQRFNGRNDIIGANLTLDGDANTIIGVLPPDFHFAPVGDPDVFVTLHAEGALADRRNLHWLNTVARLKLNVSRQQAAATMDTIAQRLEHDYPASNQNLRTAIVPLNELIVGQVRPILLVLLTAVALLLLIACSNIANLLLVRSTIRRKEIAIRTALGASRWRLFGQWLTEGLVLVSIGGMLGLLVAHWMVSLVTSSLPPSILQGMPYLRNAHLDLRVIAFTVGISVVTGILFSLAPALKLLKAETNDDLRDAGRSSVTGSWRRVGSALVIAELATAVILLVGAGLLIKSLYHLLQVDPGFNPDHLLTLRITAPSQRYPDDAHAIAFQRNVLDAARALPGVESAGMTDTLPIGGGNTINLVISGEPITPETKEANIRTVTPNYFSTMQTPLMSGRWFNDGDNASAPHRVIVNQAFVKTFLRGQDAIGKQILFTFSPKEKPREIVGVTKDIKEGPLDSVSRPAIYLPYLQDGNTGFSLVVRSAQAPALLLPSLENAVHQIDPEVVVYGGSTMRDFLDQSPAAFLHRYTAWIVGAFAAIALLLSVIGLYGAIAYSVSQRTREIGVRMALGARPSSVLRLVLFEAGQLAALGILLGMLGSSLAAYLLRSLLFGVKSWDLGTFGLVAIILSVVALLASFIPARRAALVDPMQALRME